MNLITANASTGSQSAGNLRAPEARLQDLFSQILTQHGRPGYASAEPFQESKPQSDAVQATWTDWFDSTVSWTFKEEVDPASLRQSYGEILTRSLHEGGYFDPGEFLRGLTSEELEVVQTIHRLARPIDLSQLDEEGMLNLLLPPPAQVDLNFDGITQVGAASLVRFPDSRTPPEAIEAWAEATAGLSPGEKMTFELQMKLPILLANVVLDDRGGVSHLRRPGDPDFVNPMAAADYSYLDLARHRLEYLEAFRYQIPQDVYERHTQFWSAFQQALTAHKAG